jgi:fructuronate reductase
MNVLDSPARTARLSAALALAAHPAVRWPRYRRERVTAGIVHLGIGAFHRAHQAVYFDDLLNAGIDGFGVIGASLRSAEVAEQLNPQDGLYGVLTLHDGDAPSYRVIGAVREVLVAPQQGAELRAQLADPRRWLITLSITEKGYGHRPADGQLDLNHADIAHDLAQPNAPRSALGLLDAAFAQRMAEGSAAPVVLSCDNLPNNGRLLGALCADFARARGAPARARWIESEVSFPCTMVDRIVPATQAADRARIERAFALDDRGLVKAEPFSQWVIERDPRAKRLAPLAQVGALLVEEVAPFEAIKLRLLNGAHSALAYLGYLAGCETVDRAMALPGMGAYLAQLQAVETQATLTAPSGFDLAAYQHALRERFGNAALAHRTWQIAMDGSQKLPQRLLGTMRDRLAAGTSIEALALAVAAWMRYVGGRDDAGRAIDVRDPLAGTLAVASARGGGDPAATVRALLGCSAVFPSALSADPRCAASLTAAYAALAEHGAAACVARFGEAPR